MGEFETLQALAEEIGIKLELSGSLPTWEVFSSARHQKTIQAIFLSVQPSPTNSNDCGCYRLLDTYVRLPDG